MNPDEIMKLPPEEALIFNQGMPAYIAKKIVYYHDRRFCNNAYSRKELQVNNRKKIITTGFAPPATRKELEREIAALPSNLKKTNAVTSPATAMPVGDTSPGPGIPISNTGRAVSPSDPDLHAPAEEFNPLDYLEIFEGIETFAAPSIVPFDDTEPPPTVIPWQENDFRGVS
jgi:hypothetical protein